MGGDLWEAIASPTQNRRSASVGVGRRYNRLPQIGPPAPTPPCPAQLARTQPPCDRHGDGCPGPAFTRPTGSESSGPDFGRALKKRASADALPDTTPTGIPRRPRDGRVHSGRSRRAFQREFVGQVSGFLSGGSGGPAGWVEARDPRVRNRLRNRRRRAWVSCLDPPYRRGGRESFSMSAPQRFSTADQVAADMERDS